MMKQGILILFFLSFLVATGGAQTPERFNKSVDLGYGLMEWGSGLVVRDSVLYGSGLEFSDTTGSISPIFAAYTLSGDTIWKKVLPTPYFYGTGQSGRNLQMTPSGQLLGCGTVFLDTTNYSTDSSKAYLMKVDTQGNLLWEAHYRPTGALNARFQDFHIESDGDIIAVGKTRFNLSFSSLDFYAIKTDPQGNVIWERTYGGGGLDQAGAIEAHDEGFLLFGRTASYGGGDMDPYMVKIDSAGQKLWQREYGTSTYEGFGTLTGLPEGSYVATGIRKHSSNDINFWLLYLNDSLKVEWNKEIGHAKVDQARLTPIAGPNGSILFGGDFEDTSRADAPTGLLYKVDSTGSLLWERHYVKYGKGQNQHYLTTLKRSGDGGYHLYGTHTDFYDQGQGGQNLWLLKVDSMGCDSAGCATVPSVRERVPAKGGALELYPNPVRGELRVSLTDSLEGSALYRIYDAKGRLVGQGKLHGREARVRVDGLEGGVHLLEVRSEGKVLRQRFVKE